MPPRSEMPIIPDSLPTPELQPAPQPESRVEHRELPSDQLLKAAEVLGFLTKEEMGVGFPTERRTKDSAEKKVIAAETLKFVDEMQERYSEETLGLAYDVSKAREEKSRIFAQVEKAKEGKQDVSSADLAAEAHRRGKREYDLLFAENQHADALRKLKANMAEEEYERNVKEWGENDPRVMEKMKSFEGELGELMVKEALRDQQLRLEVTRAENAREANIIHKALYRFMKLPRGVRSAIGATIIGGGIAVAAPSLVLASIPTYFAYRAGRAAFGGTISGILQKFIGNKIVEGAYRSDFAKGEEEFRRRLTGQERDKKTGELYYVAEQDETPEGKAVEDFIRTKNWEGFAEFNEGVAKEQIVKIQKLEKWRKINQGAMMLATGMIGGTAGSQAFDKTFDFLFGSKGMLGAVIPDKPKVEIHDVEGKPIKGALVDLAEVKKGEGAWQPVHRQLEARLHEDPNQFGFKPEDIADPSKAGAIKHALNSETARILGENKIIRPDGTEIRIRDLAGVHERVVLKPGGYVDVEAKTYEWSSPKISADTVETLGATSKMSLQNMVPPPHEMSLQNMTNPPQVKMPEFFKLSPEFEHSMPLVNPVKAEALAIFDPSSVEYATTIHKQYTEALICINEIDFDHIPLGNQQHILTMLKGYGTSIEDLQHHLPKGAAGNVVGKQMDQTMDWINQKVEFLQDSHAYNLSQEYWNTFVESTKLDEDVWNATSKMKLSQFETLVSKLTEAGGSKGVYEVVREAGLNTSEQAEIINNLSLEKSNLIALAKRFGGEFRNEWFKDHTLEYLAKTEVTADGIGF